MSGRITLLFVFVAAGCGSGRASQARLRYDDSLHGALRDGQVAYMRYCNSCHPGGAGGLGPSLNDKPIPAKVVELQVRQGFGVMPSFSEQVIPEPELEALGEYVVWLGDLDE